MVLDSSTLALIQTGALVSTMAFMFSRGLETRPQELWYLGARKGLLLKSLFSVDVLMPLIAIVVIALVKPARPTAVGMLLLAASPVAPMALKDILKAGGNKDYATGLHIILAWLTIVSTPITIELLSGVMGFHLNVSAEAVTEVVGLSILLPITAGVILGQRFHGAARRFSRPLAAFSSILSVLVSIVVLLSTWQLLLALDFPSYLAISLMVTIALVAGHLIARGRPDEQSTLALETATGNAGLALLMASTFTRLENALPVIIPYIIISTIICAIYVRYRKRTQREASS